MSTTSLPEPTHTPAACHGPYEHQPTEDFLAPAQRTAMLQAALDGVTLGTWDQRILTWLCHWSDTPTFLAILGWIQRARAAAEATHISACQRDQHRTFDTYRLASGWRCGDCLAEVLLADPAPPAAQRRARQPVRTAPGPDAQVLAHSPRRPGQQQRQRRRRPAERAVVA